MIKSIIKDIRLVDEDEEEGRCITPTAGPDAKRQRLVRENEAITDDEDERPGHPLLAPCFTDAHRRELADKGYTIVRRVVSEADVAFTLEQMNVWLKSMTEGHGDMTDNAKMQIKAKALPSALGPHGIMKHYAGHAKCAWFLRLHPNVLDIWAQLRECAVNKLVGSLDGFCIIPTNYEQPAKPWDHADAGKNIQGSISIQSFVNLDTITAGDATFCVRAGSHKLHAQFVDLFKIDGRNWQMLDTPEKRAFFDHRDCPLTPICGLSPGDMVFWDSRTIHCNKGFDNEFRKNPAVRFRRAVYLSYSRVAALTEKDIRLRTAAFADTHATTAHWPANGFFSINGKSYTHGGLPLPTPDPAAMLDPTTLPKAILRVYATIGPHPHFMTTDSPDYTADELIQALRG